MFFCVCVSDCSTHTCSWSVYEQFPHKHESIHSSVPGVVTLVTFHERKCSIVYDLAAFCLVNVVNSLKQLELLWSLRGDLLLSDEFHYRVVWNEMTGFGLERFTWMTVNVITTQKLVHFLNTTEVIYFDEIWEIFVPPLTVYLTTTFQSQPGKDIIKVIHVTIVV